MQYLGLGVFVVGFIAALWLLARSMIATGRNEGSKHGGGHDDMTPGADGFANGGSSDV